MSSVEVLLKIFEKEIFAKNYKLMFMLNTHSATRKLYRLAKLYNLYNMHFNIELADNKLKYQFTFEHENVPHSVEFNSQTGVEYTNINFSNAYVDFINFIENEHFYNGIPTDLIDTVSRIKLEYIRRP